MVSQNVTVFRLDRKVYHLARIFVHVDQLLAVRAPRINRVLVTICPENAASRSEASAAEKLGFDHTLVKPLIRLAPFSHRPDAAAP